MAKIYSKALDKYLETDRIIGRVDGQEPGPCLVFIGGIHGNEPSGVFAVHQVIQELTENNTPIKGSIIGLTGNLWALQRGERYHKRDLNRLWDIDHVEKLADGTFQPVNEDEKEQEYLYNSIQQILSSETGPFYFFDLHTTSGPTKPFLAVNDSLLNRKFSQQFPLPMILGIEEHLDGPVLSYINELGYVAFGFESGQHDDIQAVEKHISFIYLSLVFSGAMSMESNQFNTHFHNLGDKANRIYEIYFRYHINEGEQFIMEPDFANFQRIQKGQLLAKSNGEPILSGERSRIFMPLYQAQGNDGFFIIRRIHPFFLRLSALLRKWKFDRLLPIMPGIKWSDEQQDTLVVNLRIARILTKQFLHLLGYRSKTKDANYLTAKSREVASRHAEYPVSSWNK